MGQRLIGAGHGRDQLQHYTLAEMRMYLSAINTEERAHLALLTQLVAVGSQGGAQDVMALIRALSRPAG